MNSHGNAQLRVPLAGFALLVAMLFYVSGAAMLTHVALDHGHGDATAATHVADHDAHHDGHHDAPTDTPGAPAKESCGLCDMLAGSTHPMAVVSSTHPIVLNAESSLACIPAESPAARLSAPGISRRGPPSLG